MKLNQKHIDRIFQEKFKDFEATPSADLWSKIDAKLEAKRPLKIIPLWWKVTGVAASFMLLILAWSSYQKSLLSLANPVVIQENANDAPKTDKTFTEKNPILKNQPTKLVSQENNLELIKEINLASTSQKTVSNVTLKKETTKISSEYSHSTSYNHEQNLITAQNKHQEPQDVTSVIPLVASLFSNHSFTSQVTAFKETLANENKALIKEKFISYTYAPNVDKKITEHLAKQELLNAEAFVAKNKATEEEDELSLISDLPFIASRDNRMWSVKPQVSPVFNLAGNSGASVDPMLASNPSHGNTSLSYGMLVTYKLANNLRLRSGVQQINMAYTTNSVVFAPSVAGIASNQINLNASAVGFHVFNELIYDQNVTNPNARTFAAAGDLQQQLGYLEVPMEVEWQLLDGKFGVYASGGASTLLLLQNAIGLRNETGLWNIGENAAANTTSFSGNLGLGLEYQLTRRFNLNLEPSFRYQFNTFSDQVNGFTPYFFAVYSGVNFKF